MAPFYSVILPTYNEKDNIPYIITLLISTFNGNKIKDFEILVVDDNSPDGTAAVYKNLQKTFPESRLLLLQREGKLGLGSAYIDGLKTTKGDFIFLMDADLSHHPRHITAFIEKQKEKNYDVVSGSRYIPGGGVCGWDMKRILISRVANYLAQTLLNPGGSDLTGSYRLYKRHVLEAIMPQVQVKGYVFQMEVLARCTHAGFTLGEIPIVFVDRLYGVSKLGTGEITQYIKGLMKLFWML